MKFELGKKAKVVGFEFSESHEFELDQIVTFLGVTSRDTSGQDDDWYRFEDENGKIQELIECEFDWIEGE